MATNAQGTYYDASQPEVKMTWERDLMLEISKRGTVTNKALGLIGDSDSSFIQRRQEAFKEGGTTSRIILERGMRQPPRIGGEILRDTEEGVPTTTFDWNINQLRHACKVTNLPVTKQRVPWDVWERAKARHADYWPKLWESGLAMHATGFTIDGRTQAEWLMNGADKRFTLCNTVQSIDSAHYFRFDLADDAAVNADKTAILDVDIATELKARARAFPIPIRPASTAFGDAYVLLAHSNALRHMKKTGTQWRAEMRDRIKGGALEALSDGLLGINDNVLWLAWDYLPVGFVSSTLYRDTRRFIFGGAQALALGFAKMYKDENTMTQETESWDYNNNKGLAVGTFCGAAAPRFSIEEQGTTEHYGLIAGTSYAKEVYTSV